MTSWDGSSDAAADADPSRHPASPAPSALKSVPYRRVIDPDELARRLLVHEWVVDVRPRMAFAAAHLRNAFNFELGSGFGPYLNRLYE